MEAETKDSKSPDDCDVRDQQLVHSPGPWAAVIGRTDNHGSNVFEVRDADGNAVTGWGAVQQNAANAMMIAKSIEFRDLLEQLFVATNPLLEVDHRELHRVRTEAERLLIATRHPVA